LKDLGLDVTVINGGVSGDTASGGLERLDDVCAGVMTDQYEVADPDAPVGLFHHVFAQGKVIVVWERGQVRGLVTKIDVIDYLAHKRRVS
jgi:predicted transcriptional regulator